MRISRYFSIVSVLGVYLVLSDVALTRAANDDAVADDYIEYWTDYAVLPKKCITYNKVDMIVFSVFPKGYRQCSDEPMGTYMATVPTFVGAYLDQQASNAADKGDDAFQTPETSLYVQCYPYETESGNAYYAQVGCTDGTSQSISINVFSDETCSKVANIDESDSIDASELQLPFKQCQACVVWLDKSDDEIDDQYYTKKHTEAPLCSQVWQSKVTCDRKCQKMGIEPREVKGWNTSDKVLLSTLTIFGLGMLVAILKKRQKMSNKDALLEQAAMRTAGLQQSHVISIFTFVVLVILVFALLGLKNITWALMLIMNTVLFGYLMKLTVDSGVNATSTVIGPDGQIIQNDDSDDSSLDTGATKTVAETSNYTSPELPPVA